MYGISVPQCSERDWKNTEDMPDMSRVISLRRAAHRRKRYTLPRTAGEVAEGRRGRAGWRIDSEIFYKRLNHQANGFPFSREFRGGPFPPDRADRFLDLLPTIGVATSCREPSLIAGQGGEL